MLSCLNTIPVISVDSQYWGVELTLDQVSGQILRNFGFLTADSGPNNGPIIFNFILFLSVLPKKKT